jgi:hypothetical protein
MGTSPVPPDDLTGISGRACCCPGWMHWRCRRYAAAPLSPRRRQSRRREIRRSRWPRWHGISVGLPTERPCFSFMVLPVRSEAGEKCRRPRLSFSRGRSPHLLTNARRANDTICKTDSRMMTVARIGPSVFNSVGQLKMHCGHRASAFLSKAHI